MIRVVIADDQPVIRDGLKFIIEQDSEISVVGCASNGLEALELCDSLKPDVVLMDIVMPVCDGIMGTQLIKQKHNSIKVIILTTFNDEEKISGALANNADGYVLKDIETEELILTIKSIHRGLRVMHREAFKPIVRRLQNEISENICESNELNASLTNRELEIIKLIVYGRSNKEIAADLSLSEGGIRNMISVILARLKLKDRTQLAVYAVKNGIV